jgi:hypothetical protein
VGLTRGTGQPHRDRAPRNSDELAEARRTARIDLLPTDLSRGETAAFDVAVDGMGLIGRWSQENGDGGAVTWTTGHRFETGGRDLDQDEILAAVRETIPFRVEEERGPRRLLNQMFPRSDGE